MKSIGRSDPKQVSAAILEIIVRLHHGRFKTAPVANSIGPSMLRERVFVKQDDFVYSQEKRLVHVPSLLREFAQQFLVIREDLLHDLFKAGPDTSLHTRFARGIHAAQAQSGFQLTDVFVRESRNLFNNLCSAHAVPIGSRLSNFNPANP
jgi:hypothetical protein